MSRHDRNKSSFLETLFSRPKKGNGGGGHTHRHTTVGIAPRPNSETDFSEFREQIEAIDRLDDDTLNSKIEEMMDDMNLTEEKKEPLRSLPSEKKRSMLKMHYKGSFHETKNKFDKPDDYINYLSTPDLSVSKRYTCIESLRVALTNNPLSWVQDFGTKGLEQVLVNLNECFRSNDSRYDRVQYECLRCLKAIMNNTVGLKEVFRQKEALTIVARTLEPSKPPVMLEAVKLLAAISILPPDGHEKVLEAITISGELKSSERFLPIIKGLTVNNNQPLKAACLQLINAILSTPDDLEFRIHLRSEFMRIGLVDILDGLEKDMSEDLAVQMKVFNEYKEGDYHEFTQRYDNIRLEFDDIQDCFEINKNIVMDTPAEPYFLSILQHLLCIRDDAAIRPAYYQLIEEVISQIVLHKGGCDPDFRTTRRFQIDVQPLIEGLVEKSNVDAERKFDELSQKLEEALAHKQEAEAQLNQLRKAIESGELAQVKTGGLPDIKIPPPPPIPGCPPPPPMPGGGPPPPPPPPIPGGGGPPPPPPPPFPGMGPPPPPPPPGMGPPPPPMPGMGPMLGPRPPGPPPPPSLDLPFGLKRKKEWKVEGIKRANWKSILPNKLSEKSFWVKVQEEKLASPEILSGLAAKFSSKPIPKKDESEADSKSTGPSKRVKLLQVLDGKAAQNLSILLGGSLKHLSYREVKRCILQCDTDVLSENVLETLIAYLPPPDQLKRLIDLKIDYEELTEAEQFAHTMAGVKRLLPRLKSMRFKQQYPETVQDIKPKIVAATAACEEVKQSRKFAKILELILLMGNYMNSGSKNGGAFGFEINFLPKLSSTKDLENKITLLHYLVETIDQKFPEVLSFGDELSHIDKASRVSTDIIQKSLNIMESNVKNLEMDLANNKIPQDDDDKFSEVMGSFAAEARQQCGLLKNMFQNMDSLYTDLSEYFSFDKQKYNLEEFFNDLKTFKDAFYHAHKENILAKETAEKARLAKEAREKAEAERAERAARKKALADITVGGGKTQEGVMDSLLEALQTGSAFSRDQRRKRNQQPRLAGAERRAQLNRSRSRTGLAINRELTSELLGSA